MKLIIVESPTKAKTISNFLNKKDFKIISSFGHIRDLPKNKIGVDVKNNFKPKYIVPKKAKEKVKQIKNLAQKADAIYYATDHDREGEAIAWHLKHLIKPKKNTKQYRISFHEITKSAILKALKNPKKINQNLVNAQQARRILDRLVGYKLSPFLWKKLMRGLSAGRVQSVAVRLIAEREKEIKDFKPQEYWSIKALFKKLKKDDIKFWALLDKIGGKKIKKMDLKKEKQVKPILEQAKNLEYQIKKITKKETSKNPYPPYKTSTLQQNAYHKLGFSSKKTMMIAQQLYEGVVINKKGSTGLITYMRTDSYNLANKFIVQAKKYLDQNLGTQYSFKKPRHFKNKSKSSQEAHEAIRPTNIKLEPQKIKNSLKPDQYKLYQLIWQRALASLMPKAKIQQKTILIDGKDKIDKKSQLTFKACGSTTTFDGFLKIYPTKISDNQLPKLAEKEKLNLKKIKPKQHFTQPPARYTDATLVKKLEKLGIGRPSTYAPIIDTIQKRNYINKDDKKRFVLTEIGDLVTKMLKKNFTDIVDYNFTAELEDNLDKIADNQKKWTNVLADFYHPFDKNLTKKYQQVKKIDLTKKTDKTCPKCKKNNLVIKFGRFGKFLACSGFPDCKYTEPLIEDENNKNTKESLKKTEKIEKQAPVCKDCKKKMLLKEGRFGKFWACPNYPKCKNTQKVEEKINLKCPKCKKGDVIIKRTKKGRTFYGCNKYPKCDYASWKNPAKNPPTQK